MRKSHRLPLSKVSGGRSAPRGPPAHLAGSLGGGARQVGPLSRLWLTEHRQSFCEGETVSRRGKITNLGRRPPSLKPFPQRVKSVTLGLNFLTYKKDNNSCLISLLDQMGQHS